MFFAERQTSKIPDVPEDTPLREIEAGRRRRRRHHGRRHRHELRQRRHSGHDLDTKQEALDRGIGNIKKNYAATVAKGRLKQDEMDKRMGLHHAGSTSLDDVARRRHRHRGGVRAHGREAGRSSASSTPWRSRARSSPPTPPRSTSTRSRRPPSAPQRRGRHALLLARERDAAARGGARQEDRRRTCSRPR